MSRYFLKLSEILKKNLFPAHLVERIVNRYLMLTRNECNPLVSVSDTTFLPQITLPGPFSFVTQKRVRDFAKRYCNNIDIKLVFSSFKIGNMFKKYSIPRGLRTCVVKKFLCAGCNPGIYHACVSTWSVIGTLTFSGIYKILNNVALSVLMSVLAS